MAGSEVSGTAATPFRPATENSSSRRGRLRSNVGWPFLAQAVGKRLALTGFLSAAVIVVWSFVGRELPVFVALPAMGALSLLATLAGAGAGFAVAAVAGRDQAESVLMLSKATSRAKGVSLYDLLTAMFQRWYLERRIEEELRRSRRYGESVSVIALRIETTEAEAGIMTEQSLNLQIARACRSQPPGSGHLGELERVRIRLLPPQHGPGGGDEDGEPAARGGWTAPPRGRCR